MELPSIETVKKYWDERPCNIRHSNKEVGTREYFDEVEKRKYFVEPHITEFAEFSRWKGKRVLELWCGIGTDAINFARAGAIYTGIELSSESLKLTKLRFNTFSLDARLLEGNVELVDSYFLGEKFDLIYSFGVLHHTPNIHDAFNSIRKLMTTHSILKFMVYAKNSYKSALINQGLEQPEAQFGVPIANSFTKDEIEKILLDTGFQMLSVKQRHIFPYKVDKYIRYEYELQPWFSAMPFEIFQALEHELGWHMLVEAKSK